jgi:signal peptidase complex subunit 2
MQAPTYIGADRPPPQISITTSTKKNVPIYNVKVEVTSKAGKTETIELSRSFTEWFDSAGHFIVPPFQALFATSVPLIAKADPKRAAVAPQAAPSSSFANIDSDTLDALAAGTATGTATGTEAGKKSKRRKA